MVTLHSVVTPFSIRVDAHYEVNKGTIRFPLSGPVPVKLIEGIAKLRAKEIAEHEKAKAAAKRKR